VRGPQIERSTFISQEWWKMAPIWTSEQDTQLIELHGRKLTLPFLVSWLGRPRGDIASRLAELGIAVRMGRSDGDYDEQHFSTVKGCPPGHLMSEAQIAALYHALHRNYG
jgi:hypothetical protein